MNGKKLGEPRADIVAQGRRAEKKKIRNAVIKKRNIVSFHMISNIKIILKIAFLKSFCKKLLLKAVTKGFYRKLF